MERCPGQFDVEPCQTRRRLRGPVRRDQCARRQHPREPAPPPRRYGTRLRDLRAGPHGTRSEEHTSELQSRENLVCRLLLEKKKKNKMTLYDDIQKNEQC